jgi:peptidoglycan hydrolase CwlO-like protein
MSLQNLPITGRRHRFTAPNRAADFNGAVIDDVATVNMDSTNVSGNVSVQSEVNCDTLVVNQTANVAGAVLYVDGPNHRVGINTDSPADALHLRGRMVIGSTLGGDDNAVFEFRTGNNTTQYFYLDQSTNQFISSAVINAIGLTVGGTADVSILNASTLNVTNDFHSTGFANIASVQVSGDTQLDGNVYLNGSTYAGAMYATTVNSGASNSHVATTAFVQGAISDLINGSPAVLDTLNELAAALGNDSNFATTVTNAIALKADSTTVSAINTRLIGSESNITTLQGNVSSINSTLSTVDADITALEGNVSILQGNVSSINSSITSLQTNKANLASPAFTGVPTAPTAVNSTNTTQIATTAFVKSVIGDLVNGAPAAYDTLLEIANVLGDSGNLAGNIIYTLSTKADQTYVDALYANIGTAQLDISNLQTSMTSAEGAILTLQSAVSGAEGNISTLQSSMTNAEGAILTLQSSVSYAESNISTLQTAVSGAEGNISILQTAVSGAEGNITTLQTDLATAEGDISTLQTAVSGAEGNITTLQTNFTNFQTSAIGSGYKIVSTGDMVTIRVGPNLVHSDMGNPNPTMIQIATLVGATFIPTQTVRMAVPVTIGGNVEIGHLQIGTDGNVDLYAPSSLTFGLETVVEESIAASYIL